MNNFMGRTCDSYDFLCNNANLIAAAPELLEALAFCRSVIRSQGMFDASERMAVEKADAALARARGEGVGHNAPQL